MTTWFAEPSGLHALWFLSCNIFIYFLAPRSGLNSSCMQDICRDALGCYTLTVSPWSGMSGRLYRSGGGSLVSPRIYPAQDCLACRGKQLTQSLQQRVVRKPVFKHGKVAPDVCCKVKRSGSRQQFIRVRALHGLFSFAAREEARGEGNARAVQNV